ncbi:hypothetical protein C0J52_04765 [Blattella germanica]|nr:hypothetical protein C0J52_04765 [Blattella germanica]
MFSTICFHVVIENSIRPVKIILYSFNRGPPEWNGMFRSFSVIPIRRNWKKHKRQKAKNQKKKENCYAKWRQKPNRECQLNLQSTLDVCIAKGFTPHRTKAGCRESMGKWAHNLCVVQTVMMKTSY